MTHPAPAPMGRRVLAYLVDQVAVVACGGGLLIGALLPVVRASAAGASPGTEKPVADPTTLLIGWAMLGALAIFQWWAQGERGWTVGKYLLGLRTVDVRSGRPVGMGRIFVRGLVVAAGTLVLGVGQLVVLASPLWDRSGRNRGWHDRSAGDEVVDLRTGTLPSPRPQARRAPSSAAQRRGTVAGPATATVTVVPTWAVPPGTDETPRDEWPRDEPARTAPRREALRRDARADPSAATEAARDAAARRLDALLSDRRTGGPALVMPPLAEPGVAPDVDTRALAVLRPATFGLDPELEQTRYAPLRPEERPAPSGVDPATADLELSDGRVVTVTRSLLVGRNPGGDDDSQVIRVDDPGRSVSKTHLQVGLDSSGVWVADRGSTNGTLVTLANGAQVVCGPGQRVRLPAGATVSFGDCGLRVVRAPGAVSRA
ncbi:MAG TPA: RDD family protein [Cellulomonas sp.]|uniref:RDD family protein n=1 Tax=Cellulomonas sp. TaxID=40001 RepID=UPI002E30CA91|nr:RDD family protein [Cellulomonas sp.]HEX5331442.1 RDD family protein [Cellulomonas sp.]